MAAPTKSAVVNEIIESFSAKDLGRLRTLVDDNVVYQETGTGRRTQGADAYVELLEGWLQAFPDVAGKVTSGLESGNQAAIEVTWTGTQTGPLTTPAGQVPASGRSFQIEASIWCEFNGDKVTEIHNYLDVLTMLQQIGAM
ncbi:MAG: hypothetical protein QOF96_800 [Actinomycetota bacterium]|jgi:steroid delta-isomerase-like uncharacterized protein|nr:hypothetical protein [Actinomycetota bacterium]